MSHRGSHRPLAGSGAGRPCAVLFDLDDTLFDHRAATRVALEAICARYAALQGWPFDDLEARHAALLEAIHLEVLAGRISLDAARLARFTALFEQAGSVMTRGDLLGVAEMYRAAYGQARREVPGSAALLAALHPHVRLAIVTNNTVEEQTRKVQELALQPWLDAVVISEAVGVTKPDPRIFEIALSRIGCDPAVAVMVGDSWDTDIRGALGAGLRAVWFNPLGRQRPDTPVAEEIRSWLPVESAVQTILRVPRGGLPVEPAGTGCMSPKS